MKKSLNRPRTLTACALAVLEAVVFAGCAASPKAAPSAAAAGVAPVATPYLTGVVGANLVTATARVRDLDQETRVVTLEGADRSRIRLRVDERVRNLPQVKVGDEVTVNYYESLAYAVRKPGDAAPGVANAEEVRRAEVGEKPAMAGARVTTVTATITAIDKAAGTVSLRSPEGDVTTVKAPDPEHLDSVAVGDLVDITYSEILAVSVDTPSGTE